MNCDDIKKLIHAYMDGELDAARSLDVEQHLQDCPECRQALKNQSTLKQAISTRAPYYKAPADLRQGIMATVRQTTETERPRVNPRRQWNTWNAGLAMAACLAIGFFVATLLEHSPRSNPLPDELAAAHVRSLLATHLMDVVSTDQHTVKPWFDGKLDFAPPVPDITSDGYALLGGRLDYIGSRTVAALVYQKGKHYINLFIWPSTESDETRHAIEKNGYNLINWNHSGMTFWAVSDVRAEDLQSFAKLTGTVPEKGEPRN